MNPLIVRHKRSIMVGIVVIVIALLAMARWVVSYSSSGKFGQQKDQAKAKTQEAPSVNGFLCKKVNFKENLTLTGTIQGGARVECRFNRDGRISKINFNVGDRVPKGAVIAELETGEAQIRLRQAEAELAQTIDMYKSGVVAKPRLTQAQLGAELARKEYERSFIRAPREGAIAELNAEVGETVTPQNTVASLVSVGNVFVEMGVIEKDLDKLHMNQTVDIEVETYPGQIFKGKIARISPQVEGTSRTRTVRAELPNDKGVLLPGMFAQAKIFVQELPGTCVVPASAVKTQEDKKKVFVILPNSKLKETLVETGYEGVDYVEIKSGVVEGDKVLENASANIRDGIEVEVIDVKEYEKKDTPKV